MKFILILLVSFTSLLNVNAYDLKSQLHLSNNYSQKLIKPKTRVSSKTGITIAIPTQDQLQWQQQEIGVLIHFNLATYIDSDGCGDRKLVPPVTLFKPILLNTDNWVQTMTNLGAKYAVLVAKHACGFLLSPSDIQFPLATGEMVPYNYTVDYSPVKGVDILQEFIQSCTKKEIKTGFYYSVVNNNYLNIQNGKVVENDTLSIGQLNITQPTYNTIVLKQLEALWTNYGNLDEIWFDGGYTEELQENITQLLQNLQPHSNIFNGYGLTPNPIRWIGTELGTAPDPTWSTGITNDGGDPSSPYFCPAECDTTLQVNDRWFWGQNVSLRSLTELVEVYHKTVGRNCMLMLDLTPDRNGLIPASYAARYKQLGDYIRSCYGLPVPFSASKASKNTYFQYFNFPVSADRNVLQEEQILGQLIREYRIDIKQVNGAAWTLVANGTSIGNKKIDLWTQPYTLTAVRLIITKSVDRPTVKKWGIYLCDQI